MTPERFRELWAASSCPVSKDVEIRIVPYQDCLREALRAFIHAEAMREKCISWDETDCSNWADADWIKASWEKWLGGNQ